MCQQAKLAADLVAKTAVVVVASAQQVVVPHASKGRTPHAVLLLAHATHCARRSVSCNACVWA